MNDTIFLKKQHLSMFEEKRKNHKALAAALYRTYTEERDAEKESRGALFGGFYHYFSKHFPAEIYEKEKIVGTNWHWRWQSETEETVIPRNGGHFIADFRDFLQKGICGKIREAEEKPAECGMKTALEAFSEYVKAYEMSAKKSAEDTRGEERERLFEIAEVCAHISKNPPESFRQALQLLWFIQCFLETEAGNSAISFGRADVYLYPYYQRDIARGILTPEEAKELIICFYIKVSEGNESSMLTLGGKEENELTVLFLEAQTEIDMRQPSLALRISENTGETVWEKARELTQKGGGMPAYFNDSVIIQGLEELGFSQKDAEDYGIVGCYEASPQGIFSNTVAVNFHLYDSFHAFLSKNEEYDSFDTFLKAYQTDFEVYYEKKLLLPAFRYKTEEDIGAVMPFASCVLDRKNYLFGINILGIGILIDSLYVIKKLVFERKETTLGYLTEQAEKDFEDDSLYRAILGLREHYGSADPESNRLAREISEWLGGVIRKFPLGDHIIVSPGLFLFTGDIWQRGYRGTVNGRKKGELLSYGVMPCATPQKTDLTSCLMSCANIASEYFPNGCPVMISMNQREIARDDTLPALIKTFFEAGGFHLAVNTVDAELLKKAQKNPAEHADIIVKISGYSTRFVSLDEKIRDAVIERAEK